MGEARALAARAGSLAFARFKTLAPATRMIASHFSVLQRFLLPIHRTSQGAGKRASLPLEIDRHFWMSKFGGNRSKIGVTWGPESSMCQPRAHGVNDQHQQHNAQAEEKIAEGARDIFPAEPFVADAMLVQRSARDETVMPAAAFVEHLGFGNSAGENDCIHREFLNPEMSVEKMNGKDEAGCEQGFIRMDQESYIDNPAGQESREGLRKPHDQPGGANNRNSPEDGEVVEFFPIGPAVELRLIALAEKPFVVIDEILPIFPGRHHRVGTEQNRTKTLELKFAIRRIAQRLASGPSLAD